jgi:protein-S-isoprenylcysteine O-methyltransferase Ste14
MAIMAAVLFISAGRLNYWQGWVFLEINIFFLGLTAWTLRNNPALIQERLHPGQGMKSWDKVYYALSTPLYLVSLILAGIDAGHVHRKGHIAPAVYALAFVGYALGQSLMLWAKSVNTFFSSVVRIQEDRGHCVCREGPYRWLRHPGYLGGLLFGLSMPLVLGSTWALVPAGIIALLLIARTRLEDATLMKELAGYKDYADAVRFRLLPGIW